MNRIYSAPALTLALLGCTPQTMTPMAASPADTVSEVLHDARGREVATTTIAQSGDSLRVRIDATALPAGSHGWHVHAVGVCAAPTFDSAGPHWNPTGRQHGRDNPAGMHKGDLPNLLVDRSGRGTLEHVIPAASLRGGGAALLDADGAAVVVHASADDDRTDPSGNSGARIACAAFR